MDLVTHAFRIPLRTRFRGVTERTGVLLQGPHGWGEFSPFPEYGPDVAVRWLRCAIEAATSEWPEPLRNSIPVNVTVPAVDPQRAHDIVGNSSCSTAKVKVAEPGQQREDEARVEAVRDALGPKGKLRVDANGAWTVDEAQRAIKALDRYELEYVEQPVATLEDMAALRRSVDVPLAADESVRTAEDPMRVAGLEAADIVVLKVQPLGGVRRALEVAEAAGLPCVVSSAVETSVGIAAGLALAAGLPALPYACGLATVELLEGDVTAESLLPVDGAIRVRRSEPDADLLQRWRADDDTTERAIARLRAAEALL
ncbi:o-succinylbenzoate synthase [soil metagenome]